MTALQSAFTETEGVRLHALSSAPDPSAPAVVLVHGVGVSSRNMVPAAEELAPRCRVYAVDLPGHGRSDDPPTVLDVAGLSDSVAAWARAMGLSGAAFLGNSFGCQIVVDLACRHPDAAGKVILQGPTVDPSARNVIRQIGRWIINGLREPSTQADVTFDDWKRAGLWRLVRTARYSLKDPIEHKLPDVHVPALVVRGARDPIVTQRWAEEVERLLPRGHLVVVPDATHTMTFKFPTELAEVVFPFLFDEEF